MNFKLKLLMNISSNPMTDGNQNRYQFIMSGFVSMITNGNQIGYWYSMLWFVLR